ncbi:hypothetical protein M0R45_031553 [Rubus argutus]|uniref:Uncharacterized protein n=1 Tax=Rubus argutus TaxID=59490 RepID=A0AAW1WDX7_RUBAR
MESRKKMMLVVFGLVAAMLLQSVAAQTQHVVGGSIGWAIPQSRNAQDFQLHNKHTRRSGSTQSIVRLMQLRQPNRQHHHNWPGQHHSHLHRRPLLHLHCRQPLSVRQKLAISVSASATSPGASPSAPTPASPLPPPTTPTTPSPTSNAPCPPDQAPSPSTKTSGPTASTTPGTTAMPPNSSPAVGAGLVVCLLSLVMGLFF